MDIEKLNLFFCEGKITSDTETYSKYFGRMIGISHAIQRVYKLIGTAAKTQNPVWIYGEPGVGKTMCAQAIHYYSSIAEQPFITILPKDKFDSALFLNENATLFFKNFFKFSQKDQDKILEYLKKETFRKNNIRIILSAEKNFALEKSIQIEVPPMRQRKSDIIDIAQYYLDIYCDRYGITPKEFSDSTCKILERYDWPENIPEIKKVMKETVKTNTGHIIKPDKLALKILQKESTENDDNSGKASLPLWKIEKRVIEQTINLCGGNVSEAASMLGISSSTIYRKIQNWGE